MAAWSDLFTEVVALTKRPDMQELTKLALRRAINKAHMQYKSWRDLATSPVNITAAEVQSFNIYDIDPKFRAVKLLRWAGDERQEFKILDVTDLLDCDGYVRTQVCWGVGDVVNLRASTPQDSYLLTYYRYPTIVVDGLVTSWICDHHPDAVILMAAVQVLNSANEAEISARLQAFAADALADLLQDTLELEGR